MGAIVGSFATSHILFSRKTGVGRQAEVCFDGYKHIGRRIEECEPTAVVVVSSEHGVTLPPGGPQPPFCIASGPTFRTFGDGGVPKVELQGTPRLAAALVRGAAVAGFDISTCDEFVADHGVALPTLLTMPTHPFPVLPMIVNINVATVVPTARRCYELGATFRHIIETECGPDERVVVLGTGGLSHWIASERMGEVNEEFDHQCLDLLGAGKGSQLAELSNDEIVESAGNGGQEVRNWLFAAGAAGDRGGTTLYYEPIPAWLTGMGAMELFTSSN